MPEKDNDTKSTALYYPYIHPRDIDQLKVALLYWDRVRRIVPQTVQAGRHVYDDNDDTIALAESGLLIATEPQPYSNQAAELFFKHLEPQAERFQFDLDVARQLANRNRGIHVEKLGREVLQRLKKSRLAYQFGDWVHLHDEVGAFYMVCLATEMSRAMRTPLFSDSFDEAAVGQSLLFEPAHGSKVSDVLIKIGLNMPTPESLSHIPVGKIIDFSRKRSAERQAFRQAVDGIIEKASSITDPNGLNDYLHFNKSQISDAVKNHRELLEELTTTNLQSYASITAPALLPAAGVTLGLAPLSLGILTATGIAITAISCYAATRGNLRQARTSSPYHYLLSMENELANR